MGDQHITLLAAVWELKQLMRIRKFGLDSGHPVHNVAQVVDASMLVMFEVVYSS